MVLGTRRGRRSEASPDLKFTRLAEKDLLDDLLVSGELDAVISSNLIKPFLSGHPKVGRLFPDYKREEIAFFRKTGYLPDHASRRYSS